MEFEEKSGNSDSDSESNEVASTNSGNSESKGPNKVRARPKDPKNKSLKVKTFNKLLDLKSCENINEIEEFEYLRDCPLELNRRKKEEFLPSFLKKIRNDKDKNTALLAHSVLFNNDPNDSLVVKAPENAQGVITRQRKLDNREIFLDSLKSEICNRKAQKILNQEQEKDLEIEKTLGNEQVSINLEGKEVGFTVDQQKTAERIKNKEEDPDCIVNEKKTDGEPFTDFVNEKLSDDEDAILTCNKDKILGQSLGDLLELDENISLKRKLEENEEFVEKKKKNFFDEKENLVKIKVHDVESLDYNEEEHILALRHNRGLKTMKSEVSTEKNDEMNKSLLSIIQKPTQIVLNKSLLNSEALKNFKMIDNNPVSLNFTFKVMNKSKLIDKPSTTTKNSKKKKSLFFLVK